MAISFGMLMKINIGILLVYTIGDWIKVCVFSLCGQKGIQRQIHSITTLRTPEEIRQFKRFPSVVLNREYIGRSTWLGHLMKYVYAKTELFLVSTKWLLYLCKHSCAKMFNNLFKLIVLHQK